MESARIQDRIHWGLNTAARHLGSSADAYRPKDGGSPLDVGNRFLRLHAAFSPVDAAFARASTFGAALWNGYFDAAYTLPGDYLVQNKSVWFVAEQERLLPVLCVRTNRVVTVRRPQTPQGGIGSPYGGLTPNSMIPILTEWPASVLGIGGSPMPRTGLPADAAAVQMTVLLPPLPGGIIMSSDIISDDLGRNAVVMAAELSHLGWRLLAKQATT